LAYTLPCQEEEAFPYRRPITSLIRLFLVRLVLRMSPEHQNAFIAVFDKNSTTIPGSFPQIYGPKVIARPADLSSGEYSMFGTLMPMYVMTDAKWTDPSAKDEWMALAVASKRLWNVRVKK
jgi:hypothetical protein